MQGTDVDYVSVDKKANEDKDGRGYFVYQALNHKEQKVNKTNQFCRGNYMLIR